MSELTRESTLPMRGGADANLWRCSMRLRASSPHTRVAAAVPTVRGDAARVDDAPAPPHVAAEPGAGDHARARRWAVWGLLGLLVVAGLYLRLRNNGYGLPYVYNFDEAQHFVSRSIN